MASSLQSLVAALDSLQIAVNSLRGNPTDSELQEIASQGCRSALTHLYAMGIYCRAIPKEYFERLKELMEEVIQLIPVYIEVPGPVYTQMKANQCRTSVERQLQELSEEVPKQHRIQDDTSIFSEEDDEASLLIDSGILLDDSGIILRGEVDGTDSGINLDDSGIVLDDT